MTDDPDATKPWSIRGVPWEERSAAIEAAKRSDMNVGDWLARAIRTGIQAENQESRTLVPVGQPVSDRQTELRDIDRAVSQLRDLAAAGVPVIAKHATRVTAAVVSTLPKRHRAAVGQKPINGQTADAVLSDMPSACPPAP